MWAGRHDRLVPIFWTKDERRGRQACGRILGTNGVQRFSLWRSPRWRSCAPGSKRLLNAHVTAEGFNYLTLTSEAGINETRRRRIRAYRRRK
jgi:hypothetical protein